MESPLPSTLNDFFPQFVFVSSGLWLGPHGHLTLDNCCSVAAMVKQSLNAGLWRSESVHCLR